MRTQEYCWQKGCVDRWSSSKDDDDEDDDDDDDDDDDEQQEEDGHDVNDAYLMLLQLRCCYRATIVVIAIVAVVPVFPLFL